MKMIICKTWIGKLCLYLLRSDKVKWHQFCLQAKSIFQNCQYMKFCLNTHNFEYTFLHYSDSVKV